MFRNRIILGKGTKFDDSSNDLEITHLYSWRGSLKYFLAASDLPAI